MIRRIPYGRPKGSLVRAYIPAEDVDELDALTHAMRTGRAKVASEAMRIGLAVLRTRLQRSRDDSPQET